MTTSTPKSDYMMLIRGTQWDKGLSPEQIQKVLGQLMQWFERLHQQGKVKGAQPLGEAGRTVSGKKGRNVADGPFAEAKEAVAGYLVLEANTLDEAVAIAQTCPALECGASIEVRPVLEECPIALRLKKEMAHAAA